MDKLTEALNELEAGDWYPFHMPGHKRQTMDGGTWETVYSRDITEIEGFDNLHHAEGILKEEQTFAAKLFGAEESFYLINGSSCGILAAICAVSSQENCKKKSLLMGRNAHKAAYHGLALSGMNATYLYPEIIEHVSFAGAVDLTRLQKALDEEKCQALFLTSPTYEGVVSDIGTICDLAHKKQIPVIVDEAHGAHLGLWGGDGYFPESAIKKGADIVIQSLHKTLPSMTQTAILHVQGDLIDRQKLRFYLGVFQSSSPSYILMNSISSGLHFCHEKSRELIENYKHRLQRFYREAEKLSMIQVWREPQGILRDPGKIIIIGTKCGLSGKELSHILREDYHLEMEMAAKDYVIAMTSVMDTEEGFARLLKALQELDAKYAGVNIDVKEASEKISGFEKKLPCAESVYSIKEALDMPCESVPFNLCEGRVSKEFVYIYPPGIPFIAPGERITGELMMFMRQAKEMELQLQGMEDYLCRKICCVKDVKERG